jgi:hypothetical protein
MADTPNINQDGFSAVAEVLAGFGFNLEARTRLTFGTQVAATLKDIKTGGAVVVFVKGASDEDVANMNAAINTAPSGTLALVDARTHDYAKVRPNVATYLKSRKISATVCPPRRNAEDTVTGFLVRK